MTPGCSKISSAMILNRSSWGPMMPWFVSSGSSTTPVQISRSFPEAVRPSTVFLKPKLLLTRQQRHSPGSTWCPQPLPTSIRTSDESPARREAAAGPGRDDLFSSKTGWLTSIAVRLNEERYNAVYTPGFSHEVPDRDRVGGFDRPIDCTPSCDR